jgi:uncharacterized protein YegJ (DUF2314 family)
MLPPMNPTSSFLAMVLIGSSSVACAADFSSPERALISLEQSYARKDVDGAAAAKDFSFEADQMLRKMKSLGTPDADLIAKTAEVLELGFRHELTTKGFPQLEGVACKVVDTKGLHADLVALAEECTYPDGSKSTETLHAHKSAGGWRIVVLPSDYAPTDDHVVSIGADNEEMNAAIEKAQASLDEFLRIARSPPAGASGFKLKVRIRDSHGAVEHMWITPFRQTADGFTGVLADEPETVVGVENGQRLDFTRAEVSDWGYVLNGKQKGSFTVCVLFKHMPSSEVAQYRKDYGFEC